MCQGKIKAGEEVLDHCHNSGYVRGVLHADCNILLGKIENFLKGRGKYIRDRGDRLKHFFDNLYQFIGDDYTMNSLHPKHMTAEDKQRKLYRRRLKRAKRAATKLKYKKLLKEMK